MTENRHDGAPSRILNLMGCHNFRDLGGYPTADAGELRWGKIYRSDSLHRLTKEDLRVLRALDIRTVIDLRRTEERDLEPGPLGCYQLELPSRRVRETDPRTVQTRTDGEQWLYEDYCGMLATGGPTFGAVFSRLSLEDGTSAVFHCYGGKDRTGITAALLLSALGVDRSVVLDDYELTSACTSPEGTEAVVNIFTGFGIGRPAAEAMASTPRWAMDRALRLIDQSWGGVRRYLLDSCGVTPETIDLLRERLVITNR